MSNSKLERNLLVFALLIVTVAFIVTNLKSGLNLSNKPFKQSASLNVPKQYLTLELNTPYKASTAKVIRPHMLDVVLENKRRYLVKLYRISDSSDTYRTQVVEFLNEKRREGKTLKVVPRYFDELDRRWVVDVYYDDANGESLSDWLLRHNYAYHH